jgi:hypothetical protein
MCQCELSADSFFTVDIHVSAPAWDRSIMHLLSNNDDDDGHRDADAEGHARLEALALILSLPVWVRCVPSVMLASMLNLTSI